MEIWDLVDGSRQPIGKQHIRGDDILPGEYHVVVEIITFNADGKILLTQRDEQKTYPRLWEGTGGSVTAGESSLIGAVRELEEETGLKAKPSELKKIGELQDGNYFLDSYVWKSKEQIDVNTLPLQPGEVRAAKLVSWEELEEMNRQKMIVPPVWKRIQMNWDRLVSLSKSAVEK